jgi:hypothetical protein
VAGPISDNPQELEKFANKLVLEQREFAGVDFNRAITSGAQAEAFDEFSEAYPEAAEELLSGDTQIDPKAMLFLMQLEAQHSGSVYPDEPHRYLPEEVNSADCYLCSMPRHWSTHLIAPSAR